MEDVITPLFQRVGKPVCPHRSRENIYACYTLPMTLSHVDLESAWVLCGTSGVFQSALRGVLEKPAFSTNDCEFSGLRESHSPPARVRYGV